jgi:hypothetical protein
MSDNSTPPDAYGPDYHARALMMATVELLARADDELRAVQTDMELTASAIACRLERLHRLADPAQEHLPL